MKRVFAKYKMILFAAGIVICLTAALGTGIAFSRSQAEKDVVKAAKSEDDKEAATLYMADWTEDTLYKDMLTDDCQSIGKQVCRKFGIDYETVTVKDITSEMRDYEFALYELEYMSSNPLLEKNEDKAAIEKAGGYSFDLMSLETFVNEINAFGGGGDVIKTACGQYGIDPDKAVISDLKVEQLTEINALSYETTDHPKN